MPPSRHAMTDWGLTAAGEQCRDNWYGSPEAPCNVHSCVTGDVKAIGSIPGRGRIKVVCWYADAADQPVDRPLPPVCMEGMRPRPEPAILSVTGDLMIALREVIGQMYETLVPDPVGPKRHEPFRVIEIEAADGCYQTLPGQLLKAITRAEIAHCQHQQAAAEPVLDATWASYWYQRGVFLEKLLAAMEFPASSL